MELRWRIDFAWWALNADNAGWRRRRGKLITLKLKGYYTLSFNLICNYGWIFCIAGNMSPIIYVSIQLHFSTASPMALVKVSFCWVLNQSIKLEKAIWQEGMGDGHETCTYVFSFMHEGFPLCWLVCEISGWMQVVANSDLLVNKWDFTGIWWWLHDVMIANSIYFLNPIPFDF